jgi:ACT domain-containing protein
LEADVHMYEQEEKSHADVKMASIDEEERQEKLRLIEEQRLAEE